jgi:hypothetical protein
MAALNGQDKRMSWIDRIIAQAISEPVNPESSCDLAAYVFRCVVQV